MPGYSGYVKGAPQEVSQSLGAAELEVNKYYVLPAVRLVDGRVQRRGRRGARAPQRREMSGQARRAVVEHSNCVRALHRTTFII